jgi:PGF-pre-PGF domain-containing protein
MSEQASLSTGMPSSAAPAAAQPNRASPAPYSAGSNQRIEEKFNLRNLSGGKSDTNYRTVASGTSIQASDSAMLNLDLATIKPGILIQNVGDGEAESADNSNAVGYALNNIAAAQYNVGYNQVNFVVFGTQGLIFGIAAFHRSAIFGNLTKKFTALSGGRTLIVAVNPSLKQTAIQTRIVLIVLVLFSASALASFSGPIFGDAAGDTNAAAAAYRSNSGSNTLNSPKYREYSAGTGTWSAEVELPSVGQNVRSVFLLFNPINSQRVIISYDTNGDIDLFRCSASCTTASNWYSVGTVATTQSYGTTNPYLPVCAAYEHTSGRLVIVYDKSAVESNDFYYRTFDGSSLSSEVGFNYIGAGAADNEEIRYCDLASNPQSGSNALALVIEDATNQSAYAFIWDATANSGAGGWPTSIPVTTTMDVTSITGNAVAVGYQTSSGAAVAFAGAGRNACASERFTTSWTTITCSDPNSSPNNDVKFVHAYRDPDNTDNLMFCQLDDLNDITCAQIDGSTWGAWTKHTATGDGANTHAAFSFAWDPAGSIGHVFFETSGIADTTVTSSSWTDSTSSWGAPTPFTVANSIHNWFYAATNPTASDILDKLFIKVNGLFDAGIIKKDAGSNPALVGEQTLSADQTVVTFEHQADIAFQLSTAPPTFTKSMSEQLGIVASFSRSAVLSRAMSEQLGIVASFSRSAVLSRAMSEQFGITASIVRSIAAARTMSDQLAISEKISISVSKSMLEQLAVQVTVAPSIAAITEPLFVTDTVIKALSKPMAENLAFDDSLSRSVYQSRLVSEALAIEESITVSVAKSLSEQLSLTETAKRTTFLYRDLAEQLTTSDAEKVQISKTIADQLGILDITATSRTVDRSLVEPIAITESISDNVALSLSLNEGLALIDSLVSSLGQSRSISEQLFLSDVSNISPMTLSRSISEQMALYESTIPGRFNFVQEQLGVSESAAASQVLVRSISEQLGLIDTAGAGRSFTSMISEQLGVAESITAYISSITVDQLTITDSVNSTSSFARSISENLVFIDSTSRTSFVVILESLNIQEQFTNISLSLHLILTEMLVLPDSLVTNQSGQFNHLTTHTLTIGDTVILSLQSGKNATLTESMNLNDSVSILVLVPPPASPPAIATMPNLTFIETQYVDLYDGLADPVEAVEVNGVWNVTSLDAQGLQSLLGDIGMPVYDVSLEAASGDIDRMTIILPAFRVPANIDGQTSDDALFLTPTLSRLPAGIHVIVPIDVEASMGGADNLAHLGNVTLTFTPSQSVDNFTMMISLMDNSPEVMIDNLPADVAALYIDISIAGDFGAITPDNSVFFQQSPMITFTLTEEWAQTHNIERDSNAVPIVGMFLLDESTGDWVEISSGNIDFPVSAVNNSYKFNAALPHFSTYVVTANTQIKSSSGSGSHSEFVIPLTDSLLITSGMHSGATIESEGKVVFKDITELLNLSLIQPQPLYQRVINIEDVSVAVSISDIRSAMFGKAIATLNFEITNKGDSLEKLTLRYWYTDPATGKLAFESKEILVVNAGQVLTKTVEIPFTSNGLFDIIIEAESEDRTVATTNIAVDVPLLAVYFQMLIIIAVAIVLISISYVIRVMRTSRSFITGGK